MTTAAWTAAVSARLAVVSVTVGATSVTVMVMIVSVSGVAVRGLDDEVVARSRLHVEVGGVGHGDGSG